MKSTILIAVLVWGMAIQTAAQKTSTIPRFRAGWEGTSIPFQYMQLLNRLQIGNDIFITAKPLTWEMRDDSLFVRFTSTHEEIDLSFTVRKTGAHGNTVSGEWKTGDGSGEFAIQWPLILSSSIAWGDDAPQVIGYSQKRGGKMIIFEVWTWARLIAADERIGSKR